MATHTHARTHNYPAICSSQLSVMIQFYGPQKCTNQVLPSLSEWAGSGRKRSWALDQLCTAAKQWSSNDARPRPDHWVTASLAASVKSRVLQDTESCSGRHRVPKAFPPETIGGSFAWVWPSVCNTANSEKYLVCCTHRMRFLQQRKEYLGHTSELRI